MSDAGAEKLVWDDRRLADPHGQRDKAARVRTMFNAIAPTYERVNHWLSAGRDVSWRRRAVEWACVTPEDRVLDVACGTGDFARAFAAAGPAAVVGVDFAANMLSLAAASSQPGLVSSSTSDIRHPTSDIPSSDIPAISFCQSDALRLPYADASFTVTSCAFGVRNFQDLTQGLREMHRVLRPGGRAVILEFSMPRSALLGRLYRFYFRRVLPKAANWISGDRTGAYDYLPQSVAAFVDEAGMADALRAAGFAKIQPRRLTIGIVTVYLAWKS